MNSNHTIILASILIILLVACSPSPQAIQTAIAETQVAGTATHIAMYTVTPMPSITSMPTKPRPTVPSPGSMSIPFSMNYPVSLAVNGPGRVDFTVKVLEVARGTEVDAYASSDYPGVNLPPGMQYIFVKVEVNVIKVASGSSYSISGANFQTMSNGQLSAPQYIPYICMYCNQYPLLNADFVAPGHNSGWVMLQVFIDDPHPLLVMGPFYFSLE